MTILDKTFAPFSQSFQPIVEILNSLGFTSLCLLKHPPYFLRFLMSGGAGQRWICLKYSEEQPRSIWVIFSSTKPVVLLFSYSSQPQILTDNILGIKPIFSQLSIWTRPENMEIQIVRSASYSSVGGSINCKTALPWQRWIWLKYSPTSPQSIWAIFTSAMPVVRGFYTYTHIFSFEISDNMGFKHANYLWGFHTWRSIKGSNICN